MPLLKNIEIPVYLGCDWQNAPLHLPSTFTAWKALSGSRCVRMGMLGEFGLTWPWESLHVEALAWFDHWLKGTDTGIVDGKLFDTFCPAPTSGAPPRHGRRSASIASSRCAPTVFWPTTRVTPAAANTWCWARA